MEKNYSLITSLAILIITFSCRAQSDIDNNIVIPSNYESILFFNSKFLKDKTHLEKKYADLCKHQKLLFLTEISNTNNNPRLEIKSNSKKGIQFDYLNLRAYLKYIQSTVADIDTISAHQIIHNRYDRVYVDRNIFILNRMTGIVTEINRFSGVKKTFALSDSLVKASLYIMYHSDSNYKKREYYITNKGEEDKKIFETIYFNNDTLCIMGTYNVVILNNEGNEDHKSLKAIFKFYNGDIIGIHPINVDQFVSDNYYPSNNFICNMGRCYIEVNRATIKNENKFLSVFAQAPDGSLTFNEILNYQLPYDHQHFGYYYQFSEFNIDFPYLIMHSSNQLYNIEKNNNNTLKNLFKVQLDTALGSMQNAKLRSVWDIKYKDSSTFYFITTELGQYYYVKYDLKNQKTLLSKPLWKQNPHYSMPCIDALDYDYIIFAKDDYIIRQKATSYN